MPILYSYFRSSAAYRVRIALNLKGLAFDTIPVHLLKDGGMQHAPAYADINPSHLVPTLIDQGLPMGQSLAIMEYLDEVYPDPPLLPADAAGRAKVRALSQLIACDIHPLNNLRVLHYLEHDLAVDASARAAWYQHWVTLGFEALERMLQTRPQASIFCIGDVPGMAECCLVPQMYNARRFQVPLDAYPRLRSVEAACQQLDAFQRAAPHMQPDAQ
ncbi:maleylacetoacetate isomerase [Rhodoferax sp. GW822-FHT02A01]|uniref:maleylacetoacetate isomerase n=1 Tax=Rhodoferax sp. GW822-FHT02A01 TaxID=3141537 RepID=UPI00315D4456